MDIKLKNNHKTRITVTILLLAVITVVTMCFFPAINRNASIQIKEDTEAQPKSDVNRDMVIQIYRGSYVLNYEMAQRSSGDSASDIYLKDVGSGNKTEDGEVASVEWNESSKAWVNDTIESWQSEFEDYRSDIDYCVYKDGKVYEKNTNRPLEYAKDAASNQDKKERLSAVYSDYFVMHFDENGSLSIDPIYCSSVEADDLVKTILQMDREVSLGSTIESNIEEVSPQYQVLPPTNFDVAFGVTSAQNMLTSGYTSDEYENYWNMIGVYYNSGAGMLYYGALILIIVLMLVMTSKKIWKTEISMVRPGKWYLMELTILGVISALCFRDNFMEIIWQKPYTSVNEFLNQINNSRDALYSIVWLGEVFGNIFIIYGIWYLSIRFIRPIFTLGIREYVKQYSFIYQIFPWLKLKWNKLKDDLGHIDFSEKSTKIIVKVVAINFAVLALCSFLWFFGIFALVVYSIILFFVIKKYYDKAGRDYQALLRGMNKIAEGDLDSAIMEDIGMFEPFKGELIKIQSGFKKAVGEEVKSQRMKTELITNVSHDLKTPLTAITTYVELLKRENITDEERRSYVDTLEKKALRLKVLIEDLFEVSKASSNNIVLNPVEMDVVNLMKQVSVEHAEKFEQEKLDLRWSVPEEKVILNLDTQKTYRIFENLFVNVQKYAMPGSRVYVDVTKEEDHAMIVLKNMSATELNFKADEITERFVRGDSSRNTEGSGLGLAIAKSFTEAQGGKFHIEVDGDLFKAVIQF